jgi:type I restriction enzyme S subunit
MAGEWQVYSVAELIAQKKLAIGDGYRATNSEMSASGLPFARAGNINDGFHFDDADRLPVERLDRVGDKISRPGDVVFTSKGTVGRFAFVRETTPRFVYSPQLCFWRSLDPELIDPRFLFFWMSGHEFFLQYKSVAGQTDMAEYVSLTDQRRMVITLPGICEQRAIAHILGTLDDKIELNRKQNETLEAMARALFKAWFVDFEPVRAKLEGRWQRGQSLPGLPAHLYDLFPDRLVDSELGEIPEGWGVQTFGNIAKQLRETENPLESPDVVFCHFSIPAYDDGQWPKHEAGENIKSLKSRVPPGVVLLSKLNPEIERVWLVDVQPDEHAICSTEFIVLSPQPPYGRSFLYCLARSQSFRNELEGLVTGTSKSHQRAQVGAILELAVVRPPEPLLNHFENTAETILARTLECRRESRTLAALRDTLLPRLIRGEVRVRNAEKLVFAIFPKQKKGGLSNG